MENYKVRKVRFSRFRNWLVLLIALIGGTLTAGAQNRYIVYLSGKPDPQFTLSRPEVYLGPRALARRAKNSIPIKFRDLPVSPSYITQIQNRSIAVLYASRWLNAVLIEADSAGAAQLSTLPFVLGDARRVTRIISENEDEFTNICSIKSSSFSPQSTQDVTDGQNAMLGMDAMQAEGNLGQGALVAVLDAGFPDVNTHSLFRQLRDSNRIAYTYDFVDHETNVYGDHWHGSAVLSVMAGQDPGVFTGGAPSADYILLRTEKAATESVDECFYWVVGAEKADSLGADVINSSLGYTRFDNSNLDFSISDLDGNKLFISRGAEQAADCGIVVCNSAGNDGQNPNWSGKIGAPADADSILAVGAVFSDLSLVPFSSVGPSADGRIKPEVVAQGVNCALYDARSGTLGAANGTSFASPLIASLAAGLVSKYPQAPAMVIRQAIINSANQALNPDTLFGHGVPNYRRASNILITQTGPTIKPGFVLYPNPVRVGTSFIALVSEQKNPLELAVYDNLGRHMNDQKTTTNRFSAPAVPGVYRLVFKGDTRFTVQTLVVEP